MDYNLENKILLSEESEYKSLYSWSLQELDKDGKKIGSDQIPWRWSMYFTASELRFDNSIEVYYSANEEDKEPTREREIIVAMLHPGFCRDGETLEYDVTYSMFGTRRAIKEFRLVIERLANDNEEKCSIWGGVSYTAECDFREETVDDSIIITLLLRPERFNKLADLVKSRSIDMAEIYLSAVSGLYSDWSPSITTGRVKVLTAHKEHVVIKKDDCKIDPPRLGEVGEFRLSLTQRNKLNLKQDLRCIDADKIFYDFDGSKNESVEDGAQEKQSDQNSLTQVQLVRNEVAINSLRLPIWLIFIVLCIYVFSK